jgi:glutaredoxin
MPFTLFHRRAQPRPDLHFILYTRKGCHLCESASAILEKARSRHGFRLETVDVDSLPHLVVEYGESVPVVTVNGKVRFRGSVNEVLLQRVLDANREQEA